MKIAKPSAPFAPHEVRSFILPLALSSTLLLAAMIFEAVLLPQPSSRILTIYGIGAIAYLLGTNVFFVRTIIFNKSHSIVNAVIIGAGLGVLTLILPGYLSEIPHILVILCTLAVATISGRFCGYLVLVMMLSSSLPHTYGLLGYTAIALEYFVPFMVAITLMEVIHRIRDTTQQHIHRLETINKVSREIMKSLDTKKTLALLDTTIQETLHADTYFIGILKGDEIDLKLFYDDGEYFNGTKRLFREPFPDG